MRVVFTDPVWALDGAGRPDLSRATVEREVLGAGVRVELGPVHDGRYALDTAALIDVARGADALVVHRATVTAELVAAIQPTCRVVARSGVGLDNLNPQLLAAAGIYGFHVPDYCGDEVGTHTLALLLALERGLVVQDREIRANRWSIYAGRLPRRTSDRVAGIVGFGRIGRAVTRKLQPFYRTVLAYDPYVPADLMASHGVRCVDDLGELFRAADAVLVHAELTEETTGLVGAAALAAVRPGCLLVNAARGGLVDLDAVLAALEDGRLGGFGSDVFSPEDPNAHPTACKLLDRDDVVVTAHRAFLSAESELSMRRRVARGIAAVLKSGSPPPEGRVA